MSYLLSMYCACVYYAMYVLVICTVILGNVSNDYDFKNLYVVVTYFPVPFQASLESFTSLDVFNCPLTTKSDYRDKVWSLLPKLTVLDGYDKNDQEVTEDDEEDDEEDEDEGAGEEDSEDGDDDEEFGLDYLQKDISVNTHTSLHNGSYYNIL